MGKRDEAFADFKKALSLNPNYVAAKANLKLLQESEASAISSPVHGLGQPTLATPGDAKAAVESFDEAAEFKQTSETVNQRLAIVDAALEKLTFDAALIQEIKATIGLAKKAQGDANLQSLNEALRELALLSDPNKLSRLKEAKDHGFDTIEAYEGMSRSLLK